MVDLETDVLTEIRRVAAAELEIDTPIELADELARDLALDSVGLTVLAVALEDRFQVILSEEDAAGVATVGDLARLVARKRAEPVHP